MGILEGDRMKIRIMGTEAECKKFVEVIVKKVPSGYIRNISGWYPNVRKCTYSNEGRVYIVLEIPQDPRKMIE